MKIHRVQHTRRDNPDALARVERIVDWGVDLGLNDVVFASLEVNGG